LLLLSLLPTLLLLVVYIFLHIILWLFLLFFFEASLGEGPETHLSKVKYLHKLKPKIAEAMEVKEQWKTQHR